ncbi:hypothetical protein GCM10027200_36710 [Lentzea nigeriaca]
MDVLLPHPAGVVVERASSGMLMWARVKAEDGACMSCGSQFRRVHSRYDRRLADVAVAELSGEPQGSR